LAYKDVTEERNVNVLVTSVTAVSLLAAVEGSLLVNLLPLDLYSHLLVAKYSLVNVIPSCVWHTNEMPVVAASMGLPDVTNVPEAGMCILGENIRSMRYIIATTTLIGQMFRIVSVSARVTDAFGDNIRLGREPPFDNLSEVRTEEKRIDGLSEATAKVTYRNCRPTLLTISFCVHRRGLLGWQERRATLQWSA